MHARINARKSLENLSAILFLLLFPGFYFYHQGVAAGYIPGFLGGYFSAICLFALILYFPFYRSFAKRCSQSVIYLYIMIFFFLWTLLIALITHWLYAEYYTAEALFQYLNTTLTWLALFLLGASLNFNAAWLRRCLWIAGAVISLMLIYHVVTSGSLVYYAAQLYEVEEGVASYQGFARSALVLSFILLAISKSLTLQLVVGFVSIFSLFVLAARSEFAILIICLVLFYGLRLRRDKKMLLVAVFAGIATVVMSVIFYQEILLSRQARIFDLASDNSWSTRQEYTNIALSRINESPLIGQFGAHYEVAGQGSYAHNILSAWDSFGFLGFFAFFVLVLLPTLNSTMMVFSKRNLNSFDTFYFFVSVSSFVLLLAAKSFYWPVPAFAWGMYIAKYRFKFNEK